MTKPTASAKTAQPTKPTTHAQPKSSGADEQKQQNSPVSENTKFTLTIPWAEVLKAKDKALDHLAQHAELDGFRKGKAPKKLVEEKLGKTKLFEAAIDEALPPVYSAEIEKRGLKPVTTPQITPISLEEGKEWVFEVQVAEAPEIALGDYQDVIKTLKAKNSIWTPGKEEKKEKPTDEDRLKSIFQALLEKIQVKVPELLIRNEVNRSLSRFLQQLDKMHIPLEDYLKSVGKTPDQLRQEYALSALTSLQLDFLLAEISKKAQITASEKEIDDILASLPNDEIRKANSTPAQRLNIAAGLVRKKTVAHLLTL